MNQQKTVNIFDNYGGSKRSPYIPAVSYSVNSLLNDDLDDVVSISHKTDSHPIKQKTASVKNTTTIEKTNAKQSPKPLTIPKPKIVIRKNVNGETKSHISKNSQTQKNGTTQDKMYFATPQFYDWKLHIVRVRDITPKLYGFKNLIETYCYISDVQSIDDCIITFMVHDKDDLTHSIAAKYWTPEQKHFFSANHVYRLLGKVTAPKKKTETIVLTCVWMGVADENEMEFCLENRIK
ncbi:hypothetical protein QTN25_004277 [Entamoeba marina]